MNDEQLEMAESIMSLTDVMLWAVELGVITPKKALILMLYVGAAGPRSERSRANDDMIRGLVRACADANKQEIN